MRPALAPVLLAALLPLAACAGSGDSDDITKCPAVKPSGVTVPGLTGRILYTSSGGGAAACSGILVMNADGSDRRRITGPPLYVSSPQWSPDGRQIAFGGPCGETPKPELCILEADGTGLRAVTHQPGYPAYPAWSPDGRRLAFTRSEVSLGPDNIYVIGVDGSGEVRITDDTSNKRSPAWTPDGRTIVYEANNQLQLVPATGGRSTPLAPGGTVTQTPAVSHDGRRVAFSSNRSGKEDSTYGKETYSSPGAVLLPPSSGAHDIYVVGIDGKGLTRLTNDVSANYAPVWSPDDQHILFDSDREGRLELYVMNPDGTGQTRLTNHPEDGAGQGSWTR